MICNDGGSKFASLVTLVHCRLPWFGPSRVITLEILALELLPSLAQTAHLPEHFRFSPTRANVNVELLSIYCIVGRSCTLLEVLASTDCPKTTLVHFRMSWVPQFQRCQLSRNGERLRCTLPGFMKSIVCNYRLSIVSASMVPLTIEEASKLSDMVQRPYQRWFCTQGWKGTVISTIGATIPSKVGSRGKRLLGDQSLVTECLAARQEGMLKDRQGHRFENDTRAHFTCFGGSLFWISHRETVELIQWGI